MILPEPLQNLITAFERLPGIGPKSASRLAFHLLRAPEDISQLLAEALLALKSQTAFCPECFNIMLAGRAPDIVRSLILVDITPGVTGNKSQAITNFVNGPVSFASFDDILARTVEHNPTRTVASLRRGILHNAVQLDDGSWVWRYRRHGGPSPVGDDKASRPENAFAAVWDVLGAVTAPVLLVRGMLKQSVVDDADETELRRRLPTARVEHFEHAGHSIQGDMPVELAALVAGFAG